MVVIRPARQAPSMAAPSWHANSEEPLSVSLCAEERTSLKGAVWLRYCAEVRAARARVAVAKVEVENIVKLGRGVEQRQ